MKTKLTGFAVIALAIALVGAHAAEAQDRFEWDQASAPGKTIEVIEDDGNCTICAVYPIRRPSDPNECLPGSRGRMNTRDNDVEVDFEVRVPSGVRFVGRNVNGNIEALSIDGDVEAYTVNGSVGVSSTRLARAKTVNGRVTVELPEGTNTDVTAETLNGSIETDFPLTLSGRFGPRRINGTIGNGGRNLHLKTVNGTIRLRRSSR